MDCTPLCSSVLEISQARILEWVAISSSRGSSRPRSWTHVSWMAGRFFTAEPVGMPLSCYFVLPLFWLSFKSDKKSKGFYFQCIYPFSDALIFFMWIQVFDLYHLSSAWRFFFHFFAGQVCLRWICQFFFFFFNEKAFISPSFWIIISMNIEFWGSNGASYFKYFTLLLLA